MVLFRLRTFHYSFSSDFSSFRICSRSTSYAALYTLNLYRSVDTKGGYKPENALRTSPFGKHASFRLFLFAAKNVDYMYRQLVFVRIQCGTNEYCHYHLKCTWTRTCTMRFRRDFVPLFQNFKKSNILSPEKLKTYNLGSKNRRCHKK